MLSVTDRVSRVKLGDFKMPITVKDFNVEQLSSDRLQVSLSSENRWLIGLIVDYLTRLNSNCHVKAKDAFKISYLGAELVNDADNANRLLKEIKRDLSTKTIMAACRLCYYDVAVRRGKYSYKNTDFRNLSKQDILNIRVLVNRNLAYFKKQNAIVDFGVTFDGGYTDLVTSGDCDYLTDDGLWDLKVTDKKLNNVNILQLLAYYTLGMHSHKVLRFKKISYIGIANPLLNLVYYFDLRSLSNAQLDDISNFLLGYQHSKQPANWYKQHELDLSVIYDVVDESFVHLDKLNNFSIDDFDDGIFDISINDYCSFYAPKLNRSLLAGNNGFVFARPKFTYTKKIKLIKHNGYVMFVSISPKGSVTLLRGGQKKKLNHSLEYYYENLSKYASIVLSYFKPYWDSVTLFCRQLRALSVNTSNIDPLSNSFVSGYLHGSIIDLNFFNHLYINPSDMRIYPYHADSEFSRDVYLSVLDLFENTFSLPVVNNFKQALLDGDFPLSIDNDYETLMLSSNSSDKHLLLQQANKLITYKVNDRHNADLHFMTGTDFYKNSIILYYLQSIYDYHWVTLWSDSLLKSSDNGNLLRLLSE